MSDCIQAAVQLPNFGDPHVFRWSHVDDPDPFVLPKSVKHNTCQVTVNLRFHRNDYSSWVAITLAMSKIMVACPRGHGPHESVGGQIWLGDQGYLIVTMERSRGGMLASEKTILKLP